MVILLAVAAWLGLCWGLNLRAENEQARNTQVEPVKWNQQTARVVLNEAIGGSVSDELLAAAAEAVSQGYDGTLTR